MEEADLIKKAQAGDLSAFNQLVLVHQDLLFNQALRMLGESEAAQDAAQDAFIAAFRNLGTFRGGSFRAWMLRIVSNACYDELRRRKRRPTIPLEPQDEAGYEFDSPHWMTDPGELPEDQAIRKELEKTIQHCLDVLPDEFRETVILVDIQGLDYGEAAQAMRKPVGTVKSRLARGRDRLKDCLKGFRELLPAKFRLEDEDNG
jgi:RNA polymerase sigma-70 factor, ECF subfamily